MQKFDICIIGAGSGGLSVASGAAQLGMRVALIERADMGGDCLNTGCIPSKALLAMGKNKADFKAAHRHVQNVIQSIAPHDSQERFENMGVHVFRANASFKSKHVVVTDKGDEITAKFIVIAAGSSANIPPISGLDRTQILTNESIFNLNEKPTHLVIIGGGPIGVEMAQAHADLGCKVTLIDMANIMPHDDADLVDVVRQSLINKGINIIEAANIRSITHADTFHEITGTDANGAALSINGSHILMATGRKPNVDGLNLNMVGIKTNKQGVIVNNRLQTNFKHIYAIGDIAGGPQFTHVAGYHAGILIRNICFRMLAKTDYTALPWVTYTHPELANVGLTEKQAIEQHGKSKIQTLSVPFDGNDRAKTESETRGLIKIVGLKNGTILGAGIVGAHAGELITPWTLAISKGMKMKDMAGIIVPYPTRSEISKAVAGAWYKDSLFSDRTRTLVRWLQKLPIY